MDWPAYVLAILGIAAAVSTVVTTLFSRGRNKSTIDQLNTVIDAYKDSEKQKDQKIAYLQGQNYNKDMTIEGLNDARRKRKKS